MADIKVLQPADLSPASFTNDNTNGQGGVQIRLNPSQNNLLSLTSTGLYYSFVADPASANIYVDAVEGDDNNAGTRAAPVKTVAGAFKRMKIKQPAAVHLKENQVHIVRSSEHKYFRSKSFIFFRYGETFDAIRAALKPEFNGWHYWDTNLKELIDTHPTLKFICDLEETYNGRQVLYPFFFYNDENTFGPRDLAFYYVVMDISDVRNGSELPLRAISYGLTSSTHRFSDTLTFQSCVFKLPKNQDDAFYVAKINGMSGGGTMFISCYYDTDEDLNNAKYALSRMHSFGQSVLSCLISGKVDNPAERFNAPYNTITNTDKTLVTIDTLYPSIQQAGDIVKPNSVLLYP